MRILDKMNQEVKDYDRTQGRLEPDRLFIAHHPAVVGTPEVSHYEVVKTYPNGGQDLRKVVDSPAVEGKEAWDEYEDIYRYIPYTPQELEQYNKPNRLDALEAQVTYTALMTDTVMEASNV